MSKLFSVNDRVWSPDYGWGKVVETGPAILEATFDCGYAGRFTRCGRMYESSPLPTLFCNRVPGDDWPDPLPPPPPWEAPAFLPKGWIAMDSDKEWWWFENKPKAGETTFAASEGREEEIPHFFVWDKPQCSSWRDSLRRIE